MRAKASKNVTSTYKKNDSNCSCAKMYSLIFGKETRRRSLEQLHAQPAFDKAQLPSDDLIKSMLAQAEQRKVQGQHVLPPNGSSTHLINTDYLQKKEMERAEARQNRHRDRNEEYGGSKSSYNSLSAGSTHSTHSREGRDHREHQGQGQGGQGQPHGAVGGSKESHGGQGYLSSGNSGNSGISSGISSSGQGSANSGSSYGGGVIAGAGVHSGGMGGGMGMGAVSNAREVHSGGGGGGAFACKRQDSQSESREMSESTTAGFSKEHSSSGTRERREP